MAKSSLWVAPVASQVVPDEPGPVPGFDWQGVVVGHWFVGSPGGVGKGGRRMWRCVSRCGVKSVFRTDVLAAGATQTCEACRAGTAAPAAYRVVTEYDMALVRAVFTEGARVEIKSNIAGEGKKDWERHGQPVLDSLFDRSGLGRDFGWKVLVRDCHRIEARDDRPPIRVRKKRDGQKSLELAITGRNLSFDVDLATGRTDRPWEAVVRGLEITIDTLRKEAKGGEEIAPFAPPPAVPAAPPDPGPLAAAGTEERLLKLQAGLSRAIEVNRDMRAGADLRAEIGRRIAAARAEADPLKARCEAAVAALSVAVTAAATAKDEADRLCVLLRAATADRDRKLAEADAAKVAAEAAAGEYGPARDRLAAAEAELAEAERMEADRLKVMEKAGDVAVLLAALEKLGLG